MRTVKTLLATAAAAVILASAANAQVTLKASHQFPGGKGDPRDEMVQIIARDVKAANVGLEIQVYPGASLFKANDQWNAMVNGQLDMSSFPLDYASGKVRAFGATLMPGLVRSHDRAAREFLDRRVLMIVERREAHAQYRDAAHARPPLATGSAL